MGKHSFSTAPTLQPAQFGNAAGGKHRSSFSPNNPSFATRVKDDMKRRQAGVPSHAKPGRHAKPYDAHDDINKTMSQSKPYQAKHDVLGLGKPAPKKGTITGAKGDGKKSSEPKKFHFRPSKHEGKNKEHLKALVK